MDICGLLKIKKIKNEKQIFTFDIYFLLNIKTFVGGAVGQ